ncbi:helix-turn-helix domain-containing protein [Mycobacterium avium subsp. hominissuis]|nr:helix-turn-helix domain-containing protein [Mycobacterium avium]MDO2391713.1 helix-turn-helix domain-containing protein [Mycobacterium avium subsp. hominissuis]
MAADCRAIAAAVVLELGDAPYAGVPCWTGRLDRWSTWTVPVAYDCRYDSHVRPLMPGNPISRQALLAVAEARARYADHATGRNCRPTNERLAVDTGYSVRTVQRADTALRLLGVATEVLRGRQRTRIERMASWRVNDRGRGWASVWALHDNPQLNRLLHKLSPHPAGSSVHPSPSGNSVVTTPTGSPTGRRQHGATRRASPDEEGLALAKAWRADQHAPPWARRHSPEAWSALLAAPAAHGWTPRDLNQLITDWLGVGHWIADSPHKPIGLLGAILAWHGRDNLAERPAAADEAREAAELAAHQAHLAAQRTASSAHQRARETARAALDGPGHAAAVAALAGVRRRAAQRRTIAAAAEQAALHKRVAQARQTTTGDDDSVRRDPASLNTNGQP